MMKHLKKKIRLLHNGSIIDKDERHRLEVILKTRMWNLYCIRHQGKLHYPTLETFENRLNRYPTSIL